MKFLLVILMLLLTGCGSGEFKIVPVSGTITLDGKPLEGAEVVFAPMEVKGKVDVGPVSIGETDATGKFTLKTIKGSYGAVATKHRVSVSFGELDEAAVAAIVDEAVQKNRGMPESQVMKLEYETRQSLMNSNPLPESYNKNTTLRIDIDAATEAANFDLNSDGS